MKLTCILRAAVGHTVHELAEAPAEGSQSCSWRPGLATKTRDQEGAQERPRRGVVAQRASNFLSLRIRSMIRQTGHRVLFFRRVCDKLLLEYITEMRVQMRGHSERSRNAFRAEPFRTFRYPWQPRGWGVPRLVAGPFGVRRMWNVFMCRLSSRHPCVSDRSGVF